MIGLTNQIATQGVSSSLRLRAVLGIINQVTPDACLTDAFETARDTLFGVLHAGGWWLNENQPLRAEIDAVEALWTPILIADTMEQLRVREPQQVQQPVVPQREVPSGPENEYVRPPSRSRLEGSRQPLGYIDPNIRLNAPNRQQNADRDRQPPVAGLRQMFWTPEAQGGSFEGANLPNNGPRTARRQDGAPLGQHGGGNGYGLAQGPYQAYGGGRHQNQDRGAAAGGNMQRDIFNPNSIVY